MKHFYILIFVLYSFTSFSQSCFLGQNNSTPQENRLVSSPIVASIGYQGYDEAQAYFGEGEYEIFLDNVNGILNKPIIILDGFDPGDSRSIAGLYSSLNFNGQNLADVLRNEGFDIIVLNAPQYTTNGKDIDGGADYIQRNAMVLIELINTINNQKEGDEELVVLGPSMGGLIARYALAYMEQNSMDAETRLYISFDSPHRGANIPISLQYLINYLAEVVGNAQAQNIVAQVLNSPAAKEMLYDHLLGHLLTGSTYEQDPTLLLPAGAPGFRDVFQTELDALGFPQEVRNVAMVNGSDQAETTGTAGMQVIATTLDLGSGITADVTLHFAPTASQTINVTSFDSFFNSIPVGTFATDAESFSYTNGIDSAPGGTGSISSALGDGSGNQVIVDFINALDQDDYSFIPLISSLAIENEDDWFAIPDIGGTHTSPFVNTYIPSENEPHVTVTQESAQFALDEIRSGILSVEDHIFAEKYLLQQNPVTEEIKLKLNPSLNYSEVVLDIYSINGQQLFSEKINNPASEILLKHSLKAGTYFLSIQDTEGTYNVKFLVK